MALHARCAPRERTVLACANEFWGFQAYWISPEGAESLLTRFLPISLHCDRFLAAFVLQTHDDRFRIAQPQLACDSTGGSVLNHSGARRAAWIGGVFALIGALAVLVTVLAYRSRRFRLALATCEGR